MPVESIGLSEIEWRAIHTGVLAPRVSGALTFQAGNRHCGAAVADDAAAKAGSRPVRTSTSGAHPEMPITFRTIG